MLGPPSLLPCDPKAALCHEDRLTLQRFPDVVQARSAPIRVTHASGRPGHRLRSSNLAFLAVLTSRQPSSVVFGFSGRRSPTAYLLDASVKLSLLLRITRPSFLRKLVRAGPTPALPRPWRGQHPCLRAKCLIALRLHFHCSRRWLKLTGYSPMRPLASLRRYLQSRRSPSRAAAASLRRPRQSLPTRC